MTTARLPFTALVVAGLSVSPLAFAQRSDPAAADALFQKGREAAEKGDWTGACPKFAESQRLDPASGTLLNLADCEEHLGALASAYEHFKTAMETMAPADDRIPFAKQHMVALEKKVPHLTLIATAELPVDAKVMRDDVQLGSASLGLALPVDPGQHTITVSAPGHVDRAFTVLIMAGDAQTLSLRAGEKSARVDTPAPRATGSSSGADRAASGAGAARSTPEDGPSSLTVAPAHESVAATHDGAARGIGLGLLALGGAGLIAGGVTGAMVLGKKSTIQDPSHCDPITHACDQTGLDAASDGRTLSTVSTVAFAAGGAALAAGVIVLIVGARSSSSSSTLVAPSAFAGGAGLRVIHTF